MSRNRNKKANSFFGNYFWQTASYNQRLFYKNLEWIVALAINRFKWEGLPETCNARFLEQTLLRNGIATIAKDANGVWKSFKTVFNGQFTEYGEYANWDAIGYADTLRFPCSWENAVLVYDTRTFGNVTMVSAPWNTFEIMARLLAHYEMTEKANLSQQLTPMLYTAPKEKKLELANVLKQAQGGEPAILANSNLSDYIKVESLNIKPEFLGQELAIARENVWREVYRYLGIEHLAFEKGERIIEAEAKANSAPTTIKRLDCLQARREACEYLNRKFGLDIWVYFNDDYDSYNWAYENDEEKQDSLTNG